ncbi:uncharacterized protein LOC134911483 [Pseudophryne corroboree]|uniref:uncharacterized protein LOC134911483 n=1 Tax=Pseudophryne corroboree TaxID=495146 RepID=UPI0030815DBB
MFSALKTGSVTTGALSVPRLTVAAFDGMAVERRILAEKGIPDEVIPTLIKARKVVTSKHYHRIWRKYVAWCEARRAPTEEFQLGRFLHFLQSGVSLGLKLGSIKVQISALSIFFQKELAALPEVQTFVKGVLHIQPPFVPPVAPWDLNVVLGFLKSHWFEPLKTVELKYLTWKVVMLLALASARHVSELAALSHKSPYLVFHMDRAELRTRPQFLPKVVSSFHMNQPIVVPVATGDLEDSELLDVVRALKIYVTRTAKVRKMESLFILYASNKLGAPASKQTIARWICNTIQQAHSAAGLPPPKSVKAHSTSKVGFFLGGCPRGLGITTLPSSYLVGIKHICKVLQV